MPHTTSIEGPYDGTRNVCHYRPHGHGESSEGHITIFMERTRYPAEDGRLTVYSSQVNHGDYDIKEQTTLLLPSLEEPRRNDATMEWSTYDGLTKYYYLYDDQ